MAALKKIFNGLYKIETFIAIFSLSILTGMVVIQVFLRYVLHSPLFGIEEMETFPIIWIYVFGGTMASFERSHIQCGIIGVFCKNKTVLFISDLVRDIVCLIISCTICYWVYDYFRYCLKVWKLSGILNIPLFYAESTIFICLVIMAIFAFRDVIFTALRGKEINGGEK
ncbi:MAG: TRAP transporter small permease [Oscillospiraceae bacterium]